MVVKISHVQLSEVHKLLLNQRPWLSTFFECGIEVKENGSFWGPTKLKNWEVTYFCNLNYFINATKKLSRDSSKLNTSLMQFLDEKYIFKKLGPNPIYLNDAIRSREGKP